jgi:hypothetical protein
MTSNDTLLDEFSTIRPTTAADLFQWWKSKWLQYNIVVGLVGVLALIMTIITLSTVNYDLIHGGISLVLTIAVLYGIACNVCYFMGWFVDVLFLFFFKKPMYPVIRYFFYASGIMISVMPSIVVLGITYSLLAK